MYVLGGGGGHGPVRMMGDVIAKNVDAVIGSTVAQDDEICTSGDLFGPSQ